MNDYVEDKKGRTGKMMSISPDGTQGYVVWDGRIAGELIELSTVVKSNIIKRS